MTTRAQATFQLCETCGSPLDNKSDCNTPSCGKPGIPYEVWQRTIIDTLWSEKWELSRVTPAPPLQQWYETGKDPALCAAYILQHHKFINKKTKKARPPGAPAGTKKTAIIYPRLTNLPWDNR